jgi:chemotaxis protein MotB
VLKPHDKHDAAVIKRAGRKHAEEDHGGAWKVAFADFCLALLALFLVLWLMAAREQQALQDVVRELRSQLGEGQDRMIETVGGPRGSLIERFALPHSGSGSARNEIGPSAAAQPKTSYQTAAELASLSRALAAMSADAGLSSNMEAVVTPYGLRVMMHDTDGQGMFMRSSALPSERFRRLLRKMGPLFAEMENQMLIVGHTDSLQYSALGDHAAYSNWNLSSSRAMAARAQLLAGGMSPDSVLQVVGMADRAPLDTANAAAGVNRRIELLILTHGQADAVTAMFGKAGATELLTEGVHTSMPDVNALKQLRDKLGNAAARAAQPRPAP